MRPSVPACGSKTDGNTLVVAAYTTPRFTGAVSARKGWFERAGFERVGAQEGLVADVRIVAATHRDMPEMIAKGASR